MEEQLPVTIRKHWIGYVAITLAAIGVLGLVFWGFTSAATVPNIDRVVLWWFALFICALVSFFAWVAMYVYSLSYITLTDEGLAAVNWITLFTKQTVQTQWSDVLTESADVPGIFAQLFSYGTLSVETAGTTRVLKMTMIPNVEKWQQVIFERESATSPN